MKCVMGRPPVSVGLFHLSVTDLLSKSTILGSPGALGGPEDGEKLFQPVPTFVGESESEEMLRFVFTLIARAVTRKEIVILKTFATSN